MNGKSHSMFEAGFLREKDTVRRASEELREEIEYIEDEYDVKIKPTGDGFSVRPSGN